MSASKRTQFIIHGAAVLVLSLVSSFASARTVATQSVQDIGAAMNFMLAPKVTKTAHEAYLEACNQNVEQARVRVAAIYGENNLDDVQEMGVPNQCYTGLGEDSPPTGRIVVIRNGQRIPQASGDTVYRNDIVVTAAHAFYNNKGESLLAPTDQVVFSVYQNINGECKAVDYPVERMSIATENPQNNRADDFVVLKLSRPLTAYEPLELPPEEWVDQIQTGEMPMMLTGFAQHESTGRGESISSVSCRGYTPPSNKSFSQHENIFFHDCDTYAGMSGGAFSALTYAPQGYMTVSGQPRKFMRYFLGIHVGAKSNNEGVGFDINNEYSIGLSLNQKMRNMILDAAGEGNGSPILKAELK